jgi:alkylation response protein AidB-like acyl-CoA dehydrogenase
MTYSFEEFRAALGRDAYADDALLRRLLEARVPGGARSRIETFGPLVAGRLRELAEESARPENAPALRPRDPYGRRVDEVVLPASTREALALVFGEHRLGAVRGDPYVHYAMIYLLAQNGEAGIACALACTDGLARALEALGDGPVHRAALAGVGNSTKECYRHGAQFVTEIQGGSDVRSNTLRAVPVADGSAGDGPPFRLYGEKWFCSNINADWFLVTGRPAGADRVGLFLVPAWQEDVPGEAGGGARNGYRIERLKDKLGTRELATAEVTFDGAAAWPVGPVEAGLANLLRYVLVPSRFACTVFAAAALRQAERVAGEYARFREAFGQPIGQYPLVARTLQDLTAARESALCSVFELLRLWEVTEGRHGGREAEEAALDFRVLLSLAKPVLTRQATLLLHEATLLLGANGMEERFSPLPRLLRDCVIMETWEGPHNVLYTQALRDLVRFRVDPLVFVDRVAGQGQTDLAGRLGEVLSAAQRGDGEATLGLADLAPALVDAVAWRGLSSSQ